MTAEGRIPFKELVSLLEDVLVGHGFREDRAQRSATLFAKASLDGVASHGVNRFPLFLEKIRKGTVKPAAEPLILHASSVYEKWDGRLGPEDLNAWHCMNRAIGRAKSNGLGCVALRNTNHWMRGGNYGWQAVEEGCIGICFTNTKPNMPAWGSSAPVLGNNPLVIGIPGKKRPVVLDMAMSQFSYGKMESYLRNQRQMPYEAGFDEKGKLTKDPAVILENELALPAGLWKGAGLSLVLDMLASLLSEGKATHEIGKGKEEEHSISQVFLCFHLQKLGLTDFPEEKIDDILNNLKSTPAFDSSEVRYPGEQTLKTRQRNLKQGVPVDKKIWEKILNLSSTGKSQS